MVNSASVIRFTISLLAGLACSCHETNTENDALSEDASNEDASNEDASNEDASSGDADAEASADAELPITEVEVTYDHGAVVGRTIGGVHTFLGLPYAAPPVGDLRWRPPQPAMPWATPRDASELGSRCPQVDFMGGSDTLEGDEDCLFLNVFTPEIAPSTPMPVFVWIHGGAFLSGRGDVQPSRLAAVSQTVVVSINYRLDVLGFLAHTALTAEGEGSSGNYGILDQRAALQWVRDNIAAFGGDPANVTVAGQSAGAFSIAVHGVSPGSAGLFHRAIVQSGAPNLLILPSLAAAEERGSRIAQGVMCTEPATASECLRAKSVEELVVLPDYLSIPGGIFYQGELPFLPPTIDGVVLPITPGEAYDAGSFTSIPFMVGSNDDEGTVFHNVPLGSTPVTDEAEYLAALGRRWPEDNALSIAEQYSIVSYGDANAALNAVTGDFVNCGTRRFARALSDNGAQTWLYAFGAVPEGLLIDAFQLGAFHSAELIFLFDYVDPVFGEAPSEQSDVVEAMQGYWTRFSATGDPNGGTLPVWPSFETDTDYHLRLTSPPSAGDGYKDSACDFWDTIPIVRGGT